MNKSIKTPVEIQDQLSTLVKEVESRVGASGTKVELHEVERTILSSLLSIGNELTAHYVRLQELNIQSHGSPEDSQGKKMQTKGRLNSPYLSVFGEIEIDREKYYSTVDKTYYPLDSLLNLPLRKYSYLLQDWMGSCASDQAYDPSLELLNEILGANLKGMVSQRVGNDLGSQTDCYYDQKAKPYPETEGEVLCLGADGKGVPILKGERKTKPTAKAVQEANRLMKGQKRGVKKTATVSVTFSFDPRPRTPEEVVKSLHREWTKQEKAAQGKKVPMAKNTHKRAFLGEQKKALKYGIEELKKREPDAQKKIIALVDAGAGLEDGIKDAIEEAGLTKQLDAIILDIIHVSEYIWKAANAYLGEKSHKRNAWVRKNLLRILESDVEGVIFELNALLSHKRIKKANKERIEKVIQYLENHRHKMDYKEYLKKGYPISTGIVEGCCGHLVKNRMELCGMRWGIEGAQNMLNIRSVKKNGDWKDFMRFIHKQGKENRYALVA